MNLAGLKTLAEQKEEIDKDLSDLSFLWVNFIRIHVFDREISDADGNLIDNNHLDLLEYLLYRCSERGISVMLTPIAWFHSPYEQNHYSDPKKRAFSVLWHKNSFIVGGMQMIPSDLTEIVSPQGGILIDSNRSLWSRQAGFLKQFLSKVNRYSQYPIGQEPSLAMVEILNEPSFWNYEQLIKAREGNYSYDSIPDDLKYFYNRDKARDIKLVNFDYQHHLDYTKKADSVGEYKNFLYWRTFDFINKMTKVIRENSHSSMLVGHSLFGAEYWGYGNDIEGDIRNSYLSGVADSSVDIVTAGFYAGGAECNSDLVATGKCNTDYSNLLTGRDQWSGINQWRFWQKGSKYNFNDKMKRKGRVVYEFGVFGNSKKAYALNPMAREMRQAGVQAAAFFTYDTRTSAPYNGVIYPNGDGRPEVYGLHFLNLYHTPSVAADFFAARKTFYRVPLDGQTLSPVPSDNQWTWGAFTSYQGNSSFFSDPWTFVQSNPIENGVNNPIEWYNLSLVTNFTVTCTGNCRYWDYNGTGIVRLEQSNDGKRKLIVYPDVIRLRDSLGGNSSTDIITKLDEGMSRSIRFKDAFSGTLNFTSKKEVQVFPFN
jgi:hypothetical protein